MNGHVLVACHWCQRVAVVGLVLGLTWFGQATAALVTQTPGTVPTQDQGALWAQLLTAGVILGVGVWAIKTFLQFKDEATKQAEADRRENQKALGDVRGTLTELNHALMGIGGRGGLLTDRELDQKRRHDLDNHVHRLTLVVAEMLKVQATMAQRLDISVDPNLAKAIEQKEGGR